MTASCNSSTDPMLAHEWIGIFDRGRKMQGRKLDLRRVVYCNLRMHRTPLSNIHSVAFFAKVTLNISPLFLKHSAYSTHSLSSLCVQVTSR